MASTSELKLTGILSGYKAFDTDGSAGISAAEAEKIPNIVLNDMLTHALEPKALPEENQNQSFFNSLPPSRIASIFAESTRQGSILLPNRYFEEMAKSDLSQIAAIIHKMLTADSVEGGKAADCLLLSGALTIDLWDPLFTRLRASDSSYVKSRTRIDYRLLKEGLKKHGKEETVKADPNRDGWLDRYEMADISEENYARFIVLTLFKAVITLNRPQKTGQN